MATQPNPAWHENKDLALRRRIIQMTTYDEIWYRRATIRRVLDIHATNSLFIVQFLGSPSKKRFSTSNRRVPDVVADILTYIHAQEAAHV